jgi:hypothetical protein
MKNNSIIKKKKKDKLNQIAWNKFVRKCLENPLIQISKDNEITALAECLWDVEKLYDKKLTFNDFFKKFISYLKNGVINKVNVENMIFLLKILEKILDISPDYKGIVET